MHILLTRPLEDSKDLILKFTSLGHKVSHLPVIKIKSLDYKSPDYNEYKGIIFTSSNAVKNLNLKKIDKKIENLRGKWGYFYEHEIKHMNEIKKVLNNKFQTLTYFGIKKDKLEAFAKSNLLGIDRIVPIGQALEISLVWDGYDINKTLTRVVDIK